jgi:hypothetical protein
MQPETKIDCATKNIHHLARNRAICNCYKEFAALRLRYLLLHSLQPNQIYGNLVMNIPKS